MCTGLCVWLLGGMGGGGSRQENAYVLHAYTLITYYEGELYF